MVFSVRVLPQAELDAIEHADFIAKEAPGAALKWIEGLEAAIRSLSELPQARPTIPEEGAFRRTYRHLHCHSHRIVFFVDEATETVLVVRIHHGARNQLQPHNLPS